MKQQVAFFSRILMVSLKTRAGVLAMNTREIQQRLLKDDLALQQAIIEERDKEIREIEQGVIEVNNLMKDCKTLVDEQGILINEIELNIEKAKNNVEHGLKNVKAAEKHQSRCVIL
jgi:t-SNARE complex subunit (syntaxin)